MSDPVRQSTGYPPDQGSEGAPKPPVVVKKYANRRLYNTESSSYITLDNLAEMVRQGRDFVVYDAKTSEDITRGVLTQIIVDEEGKGRAMLPTKFLRQLIGFYGNSMQGLVPNYLEQAMGAFAQQQEKVRVTVQQTVGNLFPGIEFPGIEEVSRQNMVMMERALSLFKPFYRAGEASDPSAAKSASAGEAEQLAVLQSEIGQLRQQLEAALARVASLTQDTAVKSGSAVTPIAIAHAGVKANRK